MFLSMYEECGKSVLDVILFWFVIYRGNPIFLGFHIHFMCTLSSHGEDKNLNLFSQHLYESLPSHPIHNPTQIPHKPNIFSLSPFLVVVLSLSLCNFYTCVAYPIHILHRPTLVPSLCPMDPLDVKFEFFNFLCQLPFLKRLHF